MANMPSDLLDAARSTLALTIEMPDIPHREALFRCVTHQAYYAAYHTGLAHAIRSGFLLDERPAGFGSHEALWIWWFGNRRGEALIEGIGMDLKATRVNADYRLRRTVTPAEAGSAIDEAERLIGLLRA